MNRVKVRRFLLLSDGNGGIDIPSLVFAVGAIVIGIVVCLIFLRMAPQASTFHYNTDENGLIYPKEEIVCRGRRPLSIVFTGTSTGEPNITVIGHEIYKAGGTSIAMLLDDPAPITSWYVPGGAFTSTVSINVDQLPDGDYVYVRLAYQQPGPSEPTGFSSPFTVTDCP